MLDESQPVNEPSAARGLARSPDLSLPARLADAVAWLKSHERNIIIAAVVFQLLVLASMILRPATTLALGKTILVRTAPVDPRDLFRGDYVILSYDFSRLDPTKIGGMTPVEAAYAADDRAGQPIYAILTPDTDGQHWIAGAFTFTRPESGTFLEGTLGKYNRIEYGIESFFVQEGTGKAYEDAVRQRKLSAEIAIDDYGHATLKRLVIE